MAENAAPTKALDDAPTMPEFWRRLAVTVLILTAYRLGSHIPAVGIDPEFGTNAATAGMLALVTGHLSYFALGLTPVFSVLLIAEVFKLAFSDVRDWVNESPRTYYLFNKGVVVVALLLATLQAWGVTAALETYQGSIPPGGAQLLMETGTPFRLTHIVGLVTATALTIWLADQITRHGLGNGFWILFLLPALLSAADWPATIFESMSDGRSSALAVIVPIAVLCATAATTVVLVRRWQAVALDQDADIAASRTSTGRTSTVFAIVVWSPFIANFVLSLFLSLVYSFLSNDEFQAKYGPIALNLCAAILIFSLTYLMANAAFGRKTRARPDIQRLVALTAFNAAVTCVALTVLKGFAGAPGGPNWIALVTVITLMLPTNVAGLMPKMSRGETITDRDFEVS